MEIKKIPSDETNNSAGLIEKIEKERKIKRIISLEKKIASTILLGSLILGIPVASRAQSPPKDEAGVHVKGSLTTLAQNFSVYNLSAEVFAKLNGFWIQYAYRTGNSMEDLMYNGQKMASVESKDYKNAIEIGAGFNENSVWAVGIEIQDKKSSGVIEAFNKSFSQENLYKNYFFRIFYDDDNLSAYGKFSLGYENGGEQKENIAYAAGIRCRLNDIVDIEGGLKQTFYTKNSVSTLTEVRLGTGIRLGNGRVGVESNNYWAGKGTDDISKSDEIGLTAEYTVYTVKK